MNKKHLLGYLVAGAALAACGGESTSSAPDLNINVTVGGSGSSSGSSSSGGGSGVEIENTPLPIEESFAASDTQNFFSDNYKALASESASADVDNFYFSAAGLFQPDGTTLADPQKTWITADADPALRFGDSRWTIGQTVSDLAIFDPNDGNARNKSTPGSSPTESWGELDLSSPYTISFCVVDITDGGNLQVYVDNNTSSKGSSIFPNDSLIYTSGASAVPKGQRVVINSDIGTANSFIQFRMDSGGAVVIDDLIIENAGAPATTPPDCSTKTTEYLASQTLGGEEEPEAVAGTAFTGIPLTGSFSLSFDNLFGTDDTATFTSMSDDTAVPFNTVTGGGSRITVADGKLSMNDARFTMGDKGDAATADAVAPVGDIDLSKPYTIEIVISDFTMEAAEAGSFIVYVDNNTSSSGNSLHGGASKLATLKTDDAEVATLPYTLTIDSDVGTANSFIQLRADSKVGNITIDSVSIKYQPVDNSDTVVTWNSYSGDKKPVEADSLTLADGSLSTMVDGGTDLTDAYWSVASGIASFNTTAGGVKPYATFGPIMPEPVAYPQTYTMIARLANPNTIDKSFEIESSFGGTDGDATSPKAGRIKLMLRDDRVQIENFDGDADPEWRWDASSFDVTEFHTYQLTVTLTSARSATATVYVDGVERIAAVQTDTLRDTSVDTNRISIGENGSSDYEADVDWIIWTNDGAFTAEELIGKLPSTIGDVSTYTAD